MSSLLCGILLVSPVRTEAHYRNRIHKGQKEGEIGADLRTGVSRKILEKIFYLKLSSFVQESRHRFTYYPKGRLCTCFNPVKILLSC